LGWDIKIASKRTFGKQIHQQSLALIIWIIDFQCFVIKGSSAVATNKFTPVAFYAYL